MTHLETLAGSVRLGVRGLGEFALDQPGCYHTLQRVAGRLFGGFVLAFHGIAPDRFRELVVALRPNEPVHLSVLIERAARGRRTDGLFAITVDDGVAGNVGSIAEVARQLHWPVTFYLPTGYLDDRTGMPFQWLEQVFPYLPHTLIHSPFGDIDASTPAARRACRASIDWTVKTQPARDCEPLINDLVRMAIENGWAIREDLTPPPPVTWETVAELARDSVIRFESHGVSHTAVAALSAEALERELVHSRTRVSEHTNRACRHFCYPFGGPESIGPSAPGLVARYYDSAVTMSRGRIGACNPRLLPRIPLYGSDTVAIARLKILTR